MHERPDISEDELRGCLRDDYDLLVASLEFIPNGLNINAGVYRVVSMQGAAYLLKAKSTPLYEPSCLVPRYLHDHANPFVVAPLPTRMSAWWTRVNDWTISLYSYIEGDSGWDPPMTDSQWEATGIVIRHIHQTSLPAAGFVSLRRETFDPTEYRRWISEFETQHLGNGGKNQAERMLHAAWTAEVDTIHSAITSMERLAPELQAEAGPYVICHADIHPSNLIRDVHDHVYVIDWDDVMLAPKERDFLFVASESGAAFFRGYGPAELDWRALTYYRWERVVQDLIEYASDVCFRDALSVAAKMESVEHFRANLQDGSMVSAARSAAVHLR